MANPATTTTAFEVYVSNDTFKFNAAHFVAFEGFRERLHGHNYRVGVRLQGRRQIGADGYLIDFGNVKQVTKQVCKRLNEHFLCPMHSNVLTITKTDNEQSVRIECKVDGTTFVFPVGDCAMLPIVHATAEEMAIYLYAEILNGLNADYLLLRGIHTMEITVAEAVGQEAIFRLPIPNRESISNAGGSFQLDVRAFITAGNVIPMPCLPEDDSKQPKQQEPAVATGCRDGPGLCQCSNSSSSKTFSDQLARLAQAINDGRLKTSGEPVTVDAMKHILEEEGAGV